MREWVKAVQEGAQIVDLTDHYFCDCEGEKHRRDRCPNWKPTEAPPATRRYIRAEWERMIQARDGFVCRAPGCENEVPLHNSHLESYCDGTPATPENMRQHCANCNQLIENGNLRVVGMAPWERYYDAKGNFLGYGYDRVVRTPTGTGTGKPGISHAGNRREPALAGAPALSGRPERPPGGPGAA